MEEVNRIGGEAERNQLKRRTELIGKPSLVVYHRKNVLSFEEIKHEGDHYCVLPKSAIILISK